MFQIWDTGACYWGDLLKQLLGYQQVLHCVCPPTSCLGMMSPFVMESSYSLVCWKLNFAFTTSWLLLLSVMFKLQYWLWNNFEVRLYESWNSRESKDYILWDKDGAHRATSYPYLLLFYLESLRNWWLLLKLFPDTNYLHQIAPMNKEAWQTLRNYRCCLALPLSLELSVDLQHRAQMLSKAGRCRHTPR